MKKDGNRGLRSSGMAQDVVLGLVTGVSGLRFGQSVTDRPSRTSVTNHQPTPFNVPEERKPQLYKRKSLTSQD